MKIATFLAAAASVAMAEARFEDIKAYETFDATSCVKSSAFRKAGASYAEELTMKVPFHGEDLELNLVADRSLFADGWALVDGEGNILSDDKEAFMCHYTGSVAGKAGSVVTISVCNEGGINGLIETEEFSAEIQPKDPNCSLSSLGSHIIYDTDALDVYGTSWDDSLEGLFEFPNATTTEIVASRTYTMGLVLASDSLRMGAFNSAQQEAQSTAAIFAQMQNRYTQTNWQNGNSLRIQMAQTVQGAQLGGNPLTHLGNYLSQMENYKRNQFPNANSVQGLTSTRSSWNGVLGAARFNAMCNTRAQACSSAQGCSVGINNVGTTTSATFNGILLAHEIGHNLGMQHDNIVGGGNGFVMSASIANSATQFSGATVNQWNQSGPKSCL